MHTKTDLLTAAEQRGYKVSGRLVHDWVERGLLDRPDRHGLGRGKGTVAGWPDGQRQLFLALLTKRREGVRVGNLCNVPVWSWLWFGDSAVPLRQVRCALRTWCKGATGASWSQGRAVASKMIKVIAHPAAGSRARQALRDAVAQTLYSGNFDPDSLLPLIAGVVDPGATGKWRGPAQMPLTPEGIISLIQSRHAAIVNLEAIDDSLYHWAHFEYLTNIPDYLKEQPLLAADPDLGKYFPVPDMNDLASNACLELISILGAGLRQVPDVPEDSLHDPRLWRKRGLRLVATQVVTSGGLRVAFEVKSEGQD